MKKTLAVVSLVIVMVAIPLTGACSTPASTTATTPVTSTQASTTTPGPTTTQTTTAAPSTTTIPTTTMTTTTSPSTSTISITTTTALPTPIGAPNNAGEMASVGGQLFYGRCYCHGQDAQGYSAPALIGANSSLAKYGTAQGLYEKMTTSMPPTSPGNLDHNEYLDFLVFILVGNNYLSADATFNENDMPNIPLT